MAVLKKIRSRWWSPSDSGEEVLNVQPKAPSTSSIESNYDIRPLTLTHLDECWRLDLRCFVDGEAYSRETFEYLLTSADSVSPPLR